MPDLFVPETKQKTKPRTTFKERMREGFHYTSPSWALFENIGADFHDFELANYINFLDKVESLENLLEGLRLLSPFTDDALEVAEKMNEKGFTKFKKALPGVRRKSRDLFGEQLPLFPELEPPKMLCKYSSLLIPKRFITAVLASEKFDACLGVALIRIMELEKGF